jgi:PTH1 family peptidyl-tRNA hydrolase
MSKFLIVGLGNIGDEYDGTRHNIGFEVLDHMAAEAGVKFVNERHAYVAEMKHKGKILVLVKPTTFMNLSGKAVNYWMQAEKIPTENIMVIVDDLALPFGKIRIGPKGGDGGHNGLKHIQETLNTTNYPRMRFGIGNVPIDIGIGKGYQVNYVLGKWNSEEQKTLKDRLKIASDAIKAFAFQGLQFCMNNYNNK